MKRNLELTRLLILNLQNKHADFAGVKFEISAMSISEATSIPSVGEKWFKNGKLERDLFEPFIKRRYREGNITIFPFSHLKHRYAPLMLTIMKYFTYEGRSLGSIPIILDSLCISQGLRHLTYPTISTGVL